MNVPGPFVRAQVFGDEAHERVRILHLAGTKDDEGRDALPEIIVWDPHDRDLSDRRVLEQRSFDLSRTDAVSARFDQIGASAA